MENRYWIEHFDVRTSKYLGERWTHANDEAIQGREVGSQGRRRFVVKEPLALVKPNHKKTPVLVKPGTEVETIYFQMDTAPMWQHPLNPKA